MWSTRLEATQGMGGDAEADLDMVTPGARFARAFSALLAGALLATLLPGLARAQGAAIDPEASTVTFFGGGWGHGVGLSQYGAQAQAMRSRGYQEILQSYFTGIGFDTLGGEIADPGPVWVGIRQNLTSVDIAVRSLRAEPGFVTITRGDGETQERQDVFSENVFTIALVDGGCGLTVQDIVWPPGSCNLDVAWDGWATEPGVVLDIGTRSYARGMLHIRPNKPADQPATGFHLVMEIDLEQYLYGLAEVPYSWAPEALRTQAVAGRSYAANKMAIRGHPTASTLRQELCWCQVYDSTLDQYYIGFGREDARWVAAVEETRGVVMRHTDVFGYDGVPIAVPAFYSSSTFGHTEDSGVAFGSGWTPQYLRGVPDPWSIDPIAANPYASWQKQLSLGQLAPLLGMDAVTGATIKDCSQLPGPAWSTSKAALEVEFSGVVGGAAATTCFYTRALRTRLGLRSMQVTRVETNLVPDPTPLVEPVPVYASRPATQDPLTGIWTLLRSDGTTPSFYYGIPDDIPMACDWNGDGVATVGLYRSTEGYLYLRNSNTQGFADISIFYGIPEDLPVCGDWDGDGVETIGIFRPSERKFYLRNSNTQGFGEIELVIGAAGTVPVAGDWDGNGFDTVGVFDAATRTLSLTNSSSDPAVAVVFDYSGARTGDRIVVGDWNADGVDSVGVFRPSNATFYLRDTFDQPAANYVIPFGAAHLNPVAGPWGP